MTNYYFIPVFLGTVSKNNFFPQPRIDSALVKLFPRANKFGIDDKETFLTVSKALFTNKMKKVRNALVDSRHIINMKKNKMKIINKNIIQMNHLI